MTTKIPHVFLVGALIVVLLLGGGYFAYSQGSEPAPELVYHRVSLDGDTLGYVQDPGEVREALRDLTTARSKTAGQAVVPEAALEFTEVTAEERRETLTQSRLQQILADRIEFAAEAAAIVIGGEPVVAVASRAEAEQLLEDLRTAYVAQISERWEEADVADVRPRQDVEIQSVERSPAQIIRAAEARDILARGTTKRVTHTVEQGETAWGIARANEMTVASLEEANPELGNAEQLQPGDELSLVVPDPYLTYTGEVTATYSETIPYQVNTKYDGELWPWQTVVEEQGANGQREVRVRVSMEGGSEVDREVLEETVLEEPQTRVVVRGTRTVPPQGTGQYVWPVAGQITSYFGWRGGRRHNGVDIGSDWGASVNAADSGTVVAAGWQGGYGRRIRVDHGEGAVVTVYAHLAEILVSPGDQVSKGQAIGKVGTTGYSTGPHLHFEMHFDGSPADPVKVYEGQ